MSDSAELLFSSLNDIASVKSLLGTSEHLHLECKRAQHPLKDSDQGSLAKVLSGFANADGGVLVYGLGTRSGGRDTPDVIDDIDPVKNVKELQANVLGIVGQLTDPPIAGIRTNPIVDSDGSGFLVVLVPASDLVPHRSRKNHEYYRRTGSSTYPMEHYEIGDMFGSRRGPKLSFWAEVRKGSQRQEGNVTKCQIVIGIENLGRGIAKYPFLRIWDMPNSRVYPYGLDGNGNVGLHLRPTGGDSEYTFGGTATEVVYPSIRLPITVIEHYAVVDPTLQERRFPKFNPKYELAAEGMPATTGDLLIK